MVYCPVGFVADHLEVLYDNDYECKVVKLNIFSTSHYEVVPYDSLTHQEGTRSNIAASEFKFGFH